MQTEMIAIDFEGTGVVGEHPNEPWQIGMVLIRNGKVEIETSYNRLLRTGDRPYNPHAPGLHHQLKDEILRAQNLRELWPEVSQWWLNRPLVAHNCATERGFMTQAAPMHQLGPWIDTLNLARHVYPKLESHSLEDLLDHLQLMHQVCELCPGLLPHDAWFDAVGCAVLLQHFLELPGWDQVTVSALANVKPKEYRRKISARTPRAPRSRWQ